MRGIGAYQSNIAWIWAEKAEQEGRPWQLLDGITATRVKEGTVVATDVTGWGNELKVVFEDGSNVVVPEGGKVVMAGQGYFTVLEADGKYVASGKTPHLRGHRPHRWNRSQRHRGRRGQPGARAHRDQDRALDQIIQRPADRGGEEYSADHRRRGAYQLNSQWPELGRHIGEDEITAITNIVAAGGGNMTRNDIANIVAAGGGNPARASLPPSWQVGRQPFRPGNFPDRRRRRGQHRSRWGRKHRGRRRRKSRPLVVIGNISRPVSWPVAAKYRRGRWWQCRGQ